MILNDSVPHHQPKTLEIDTKRAELDRRERDVERLENQVEMRREKRRSEVDSELQLKQKLVSELEVGAGVRKSHQIEQLKADLDYLATVQATFTKDHQAMLDDKDVHFDVQRKIWEDKYNALQDELNIEKFNELKDELRKEQKSAQDMRKELTQARYRL